MTIMTEDMLQNERRIKNERRMELRENFVSDIISYFKESMKIDSNIGLIVSDTSQADNVGTRVSEIYFRTSDKYSSSTLYRIHIEHRGWDPKKMRWHVTLMVLNARDTSRVTCDFIEGYSIDDVHRSMRGLFNELHSKCNAIHTVDDGSFSVDIVETSQKVIFNVSYYKYYARYMIDVSYNNLANINLKSLPSYAGYKFDLGFLCDFDKSIPEISDERRNFYTKDLVGNILHSTFNEIVEGKVPVLSQVVLSNGSLVD